jgi:hypothetical protein
MMAERIGTSGALASVTTLTIDHQAAPSGAALHLVCHPQGPYLACNNAGNATGTVELGDGTLVTVIHNANPASNLGGVPVVVSPGGELRAVCPTLADEFVRTTKGRTLKIAYVSTVTGNGTAVNYHIGGSTASLRMQSTIAAAADILVKTSNVYELIEAVA